MADPLRIPLALLQQRRLGELSAAVAQAQALYTEACNIVALGMLDPALVSQASVAHEGDVLVVTVG